MSTINVTYTDDYAVVELNRPKANAINMQMTQDLRETFSDLAASESVNGAILIGQGTIFSAGLDVVEIHDYTEAEYVAFWDSFGQLINDLVDFPKPLVAAINGHAPAGGCVLALCADSRIMSEGKGRIGLNEVPVGVVIPQPIVELARCVLGYVRAGDMIYHGALMLPEEAGAFGLVHAIVPHDELLVAAEAKLKSWLELPQEPWRKAKAALRRPLREAMKMDSSEAYGDTIRYWWSDESRARIGEMLEKLQKK